MWETTVDDVASIEVDTPNSNDGKVTVRTQIDRAQW